MPVLKFDEDEWVNNPREYNSTLAYPRESSLFCILRYAFHGHFITNAQ